MLPATTQSAQPQDAPTGGLESQQAIPLQSLPPQQQAYNQALPARPKPRKRDLKHGEKSQQQQSSQRNNSGNGIQHIESNGSSAGPPRKMQKLAEQMAGPAALANNGAPLSPMQGRGLAKQAQLAGLPTTGACEPGNADGASGPQKAQLDEQMGRQMPGSAAGGSLPVMPTKENHGRTP
jgi:hypothetical protein